MSALSSNQSRRKLLKLGTTSIISITSLFNSGCDFLDNEKISIEQKLIRPLNHLKRAKEIGEIYKSQNKSINALSTAQLTTKLIQRLNLNPEELEILSEEKLTTQLGKKIRTDFIEEDVIIVDTWMFSKTELLLCALVSTLPNTQ